MAGENLVFPTYDVVAEPTGADEVVVGRLAGVSTIFDGQPVYLHGFANVSPSADGVTVIARVRRNTLTGTEVGDPVDVGVALDAAGDPTDTQVDIYVRDLPGNAQNATYVLTLEVPGVATPTSVNMVYVEARVG